MLTNSDANNTTMTATGHGSAKSLFSLFRSLSDSRKTGSWRSPTNAPTVTQTDDNHPTITTKLSSRIKKHSRRPRTANSLSLDQGTPESPQLHFKESRMMRLARGVAPPPSSYQILHSPEAGSAPLKAVSCDGHSPTARNPSRPSTSYSSASLETTYSLPPPPPSDMFPGELGAFPDDVDTFQLNQRRKASMSKLMRHFGETRIPPEFFSVSPATTSAPVDSPPKTLSVRPKKGRTKSLDMKSFPGLGMAETKPRQPTLHRSRSLGRRSLSAKRSMGNLSSSTGEIETTQHRVRRARKMAQILGPEINASLPQLSRTIDEPDRAGAPVPQADYPPSIRTTRLSGEDTDPAPAVVPDENEVLLDVPATPLSVETEVAEHHRRTRKLANFFGVSQNDISGSVPHSARPRTSDTSLSPHSPLPLQDVEVNIKLAGRRFWGLTPDRPKYHNVQTSDAIVIDQLRTLKSG